MTSFFKKHVLTHPYVLASFGLVGLIAIGSIAYYVMGSQVPSPATSGTLASTTASIVGNGVVEPSQNPDLAFESGGRVTRVSVAVGNTVAQGQVLASIDSATLSAQREQAQAALRAQQANLAQMQAGPRQVDITAKQTAVSQAQLSLANMYANAPQTLQAAYGSAFAGVSSNSDTLFSNPNTSNPTLNFITSNSQAQNDAVSARISLNTELKSLSQEASSLGTSPDVVEAEIPRALAHLTVVRNYSTTLLTALSQAIPTTQFPAASVSAAITSVTALQTSINSLISSLQANVQQLASAKLSVQSAQDALNQTLAGSTKEQLDAQQAQVEAAQANVAAIDAQISKTIIRAPFAGSVSSVRVKVGDIASADVPAISLSPSSALQVSAYFSEIDVVHITVGASADITLDAYGSARVFPATVVSVDRSPTQQNGVSAYKVTMQFTQNDPAIAPGMTANASIKQ